MQFGEMLLCVSVDANVGVTPAKVLRGQRALGEVYYISNTNTTVTDPHALFMCVCVCVCVCE